MFDYLNNNYEDIEINKVNNLIKQVIVDYKKMKYQTDDTGMFLKDSLKTIGKLVSERFGVNIEIKNKPINTIHIRPSVNQYNIDLKNRIKKKMEKQIIKKGLNNKVRDFLYTLNNIENDLKKGIKIDTENLKILTPNEYKYTIEIDMVWLIDNDLSDREITSILLHEIGHIYESFLTLHNVVNNSIDMSYTILGYLNSGNDPKTTILKAFEDKLGTSINEDNISTETVFTLYKKYTLDNYKNFTGYNTDYKKENIADMFATKLGYGSDIAIALSKLERELDDIDTYYYLGNSIVILGVLSFLITQMGIFILSFILLTGILLMTAGMFLFLGTIAFLVWLLSNLLGTGQIAKNNNSHEDLLTRVQRIKNKVISLSTKIRDKETGQRMIKEVKELNSLLNTIRNSLNVKIDKLFTTNSGYTLIEMVDNLINNEMYIQTLRLKYLKGD